MFFRRRVSQANPRGQGLVEFALILPLLALLLVMAIDFGRVFFGWVGLHNAARIAANSAGFNPDAWAPPGDTDRQDIYRDLVLHDLQALNCEQPGGGAWTAGAVPDPVFEDKPATSFSSDPYEIGDHASVTLSCEFDLLTPIAGMIVGNPYSFVAQAEFPVRGGEILGIPVGATPPPPGCVDHIVPNMVGSTVADARLLWTDAGFTGLFTPTTGSDTDIVSAQTTVPLSSPGDCMIASIAVLVTHAPPGPCSGSDIQVPNLFGMTVAEARNQWTAVSGFTGAFTPTPAAGVDTYEVETQDTTPDSTPGECMPPDTPVTVTYGPPDPPQCSLPDLTEGTTRANAGQIEVAAAGFTNYTIHHPPNGNYIITTQSPVGGQDHDCDTPVEVFGN